MLEKNECLNANIYSYLKTTSGQNSKEYLNAVHFFNTNGNYTSLAAQDSCFPTLVSNMCCSISCSESVFATLHFLHMKWPNKQVLLFLSLERLLERLEARKKYILVILNLIKFLYVFG
jgi:hypothetical protein